MIDAAGTGLDAGRLARIPAFFERHYLAPGKIAGCQIRVARRGRLALACNLGLTDRERGLSMADDTIFRIYSMTKPITSVALMTLWEQGAFQLDDPVGRYVPSWRAPRAVWVSEEGEAMVTEAAHRPITFRDLLTHTAGLTYGGGLPGIGIQHPVDHAYRALGIRSLGGKDDARTFLDKLAEVPLRHQPGAAWMYSLATDACGALVEVLSGRPFADYVRAELLEPLGMADTGFSVPPDDLARFAANYVREPDKTLRPIDDRDTSPFVRPPAFASGGGGLVGTGPDYLRFCEMLRGGGALDGARILGPRTLDLMLRNHLPGGAHLGEIALDPFPDIAPAGLGFGLGFALAVDPLRAGWPSRADAFWSGAASTFFWIDPAEQLSVVFMTQLMPAGSFDFRGQLKTLVYAAICG